MTLPIKCAEGKERSLTRKRKREFHQSQIDKLPNEFKNAFANYNHRNSSGIGYFDENKYLIE